MFTLKAGRKFKVEMREFARGFVLQNLWASLWWAAGVNFNDPFFPVIRIVPNLAQQNQTFD